METLTITEDADFSEIENAFEVVTNSQDLCLRLPNSFKNGGIFGIEGLISQLLATWLKECRAEHIFHSFCNADDQKSFSNLGSKFYGMIALKQASKILSNDLITVDQDFALQSSYERVRFVISKNFHRAYEDLYVAIPSIKSKGINREYNCPFYLGDKVVGKNEFRRIVGLAIDRVIDLKERRDYVDEYIDHVSEMIRELFDNTHKHSRTDQKSNILPTNFRAVIFNSSSLTKEQLYKFIESRIEGITGFVIECENWIEANNRDLPVLDITVVDGGPGYARKWTGKNKDDLTLDDEIEAVYSCFKKNHTTTDNNADGTGLTHVLKDLSKIRGWFRLRTGSISVSKSFFLGGSSSEIKRADVKHCGAFIEGASFNIVMPLVKVSGE